MFRNKWLPYFAPETPTPAGGSGSSAASATPSGDMGKEDMIEFLAGDDDPPETLDLTPKGGKEKDEKKDKKDDKEEPETPETDDKDDDELDELKEIEDELQEPTDEQLELVTPVRRREILAKYPQLFKDFPYLEKAYYREQQFTELLPTIEDAKRAVEATKILDNFEKDLMSGNSETVLKAVKAENPQAFNKMVDGYMMTLRNVDEQAYFHVLGNITKHTIAAMAQEAKRSDNKGLQDAALLLNQFVFGTSTWEPPTNLAKPDDKDSKDKDQVSEREQKFVTQQFNSTRDDLNTRVNNTLRNTIQAHIDPKASMTDYVRRNAERDAMEKLDSLIGRDSRFKVLVDKLWEKAYSDGFSNESKERIKSAYLSKAKSLLPAVIKQARNEALRGIGKRVKEEDNDSETVERDGKKGPVQAGRPRSQISAGKIKDAKDIPKGMKTIDFLSAD